MVDMTTMWENGDLDKSYVCTYILYEWVKNLYFNNHQFVNHQSVHEYVFTVMSLLCFYVIVLSIGTKWHK